MTGLEKIKSQILDEAKADSDSKIAEAKAKADEIVAQAEADAKKISETIAHKSELDTVNYKERTASSIDLQRRTKLLAAKQEMIQNVLDKAYESLESMNEEEYFGVLLKLLARYALPQDGEIFFSAGRSRECLTTLKMQWRTLRRTKAEALRFPQKKERLRMDLFLPMAG